MAQVDRYWNPGSVGGDGTTPNLTGATAAYASLSSLLVNEATDLVTATNNLYAWGAGTTSDTTAANVTGFTTSALYDVVIDGQTISPTWDSGYLIQSVTNATAVTVSNQYVTIRNLQIFVTGNTAGTYRGIYKVNSNIYVEKVFARASLSGTGTIGIGFGFSTAYTGWTIDRSLAVDWVNGTEACYGYYLVGAGSETISNCGAYNCYNGYYNDYQNVIARNCWAMSCTDGWITAPPWQTGSDYNASDIASDAPGANSQNGTAITFVNAASDNYHLDSSDTVAIGNGTNLTSLFTTDMEGDALPGAGAWDIGPDYYVAASGVTVNIIGNSSTTGIGTLSSTGGALASLSGNSSSGSVGLFTPLGGAIITLLGSSLSGSAGSFTITGGVSLTITGVSSSGQAGTLTASAGSVVIGLTGVSVNGQAGTISISGGTSISLIGIEGIGYAGNITLSVETIASLLGVSSTGYAGILDITGGATISITGSQAQGYIGSLNISIGVTEIVIPGYRVYTITKDDRTYLIFEEDRVYTIQ